MFSEKLPLPVALGVILIITFAAYTPAIKGRFVWDDDGMLTNNLVLKENGLYHSWFATYQPNYWPITWTSYWLQYQLWGLNPAGYHLVNILIHAACALLIWRILLRLNIPGAWLAALIFAVHPVNVESVAWIAQLKTVLSMLFFLLAVLLYLQFDGGGRQRLYWLAVVSFILAMLSKGSVVALPVVLLMCAWWLHRTITRRDLLRSIPFFAISAVMAGVEIWFQYARAIAGDVIRTDTFLARLAGAGSAVWFYIYKMLLPISLSFIYPRWNIDPRNWLSYVPDIALLGLLVLCWLYRRSWGRPVLFALAYYIVMLLPVLGFFNIYFMKYSLVADHYQYVSIIGVIAILVAAGHHIAARFGRQQASAARIVAAFVLLAFGALSWHRSCIYKDSETIWRDTLHKNPSAWIAHNYLGTIIQSQGKIDEAINHYNQALLLKPDLVEAHNNLGMAAASLGKLDQAVEYLRKALLLNPSYAEAYSNLGNVLFEQGKIDEAVRRYRQALLLQPGYADAHNNLGVALQLQGKLDEAVNHFRQALLLMPRYVDAYINLGLALQSQGNIAEAVSHYRHVLQIDPNNTKAGRALQALLKNTSSAPGR